MLIPLKDVITKYALNIKGVIQVGAHWAEEHDIYVQLGIKNIVYIEPCKEAFNILHTKFLYPGELHSDGVVVELFDCACGEEEGEFDMYVSHDNQGQSNSLLKPLLHLQQHPEVKFTAYERVKVMRLDDLPFKREDYNLLVLDTQGAEGMVLAGAKETLKHIDCVYSEINTGQTYEGNALVDELDDVLAGYNFRRVETKMPSANWTWGDAVWIKPKTRDINIGNYKNRDGLQVYEVDLPE